MSKVTIIDPLAIRRSGINTGIVRRDVERLLRNGSTVTQVATLLLQRVEDVQAVADEVYAPLLKDAWWKQPKA